MHLYCYVFDVIVFVLFAVFLTKIVSLVVV